MFNSIVVGIIFTVIVYLYLWWKSEDDHKKDPKSPKKSVNYVIPCVVGVFAWFISSFYFDGEFFPTSDSESVSNSIVSEIITTNKENLNPINNKGGNSDNSESYRLIGTKRVTLPTTDVFIDLAKF